MIDKSKLKDYANKLMFDMNEEEYETLQKEFEIIQKQMEIIGEIDEIKNVEPMTFPYKLEEVSLRDDNDARTIDVEDALSNCHRRKGRDVRVPRVVE